MRRIKSYLVLLAAALLAGCNGIERPFEGTYDQVLIYFGMGYNNLSSNLKGNLDELRTDVLPGLSYDKAIVAFCHNVQRPGDYNTDNPPVLMRIFRGSDGKPVTDTLKVYEDMELSASAESMRRVLIDIQERFPAERYGMIVSSHGTGWLPPGYNYNSEVVRTRRESLPQPAVPWPETKAIGNQYVGSSSNPTWIPLPDFAKAIPIHLDYLILDTCLSGAVEVAYELQNVCDWLIVSPAEILTAGMNYTTLSWDMFAGKDPDLLTYCQEYFRSYDAKEGNYRAATVTLVDCSKLNDLARVFSDVMVRRFPYRDDELRAVRNATQRYFYESSSLRFFYDLRDFAVQAGATPEELQALDAALAAAVPYHAETPTFFDLPLERCCGLSIYIPEDDRPQLNAAYKQLHWYWSMGYRVLF